MTQRIHVTPAQIFANIPGLLGFYPEESIIFLNFALAKNGSKVRLALDFSSRTDLNDWNATKQACTVIADHKPDVVWALIVSGDSDPYIIDEALEELVDLAESAHLPLAAVWVTPEIASGSPFVLGVRAEEDSGITTIPCDPEWVEGEISDVATAVSTMQLVEDGQLPELSRADVLSRFAQGNPHVEVSASQLRRLAEDARELAATIRLGGGVDRVRDEFQTLLTASATATKETAVMKNEDLLFRGITIMSNKLTRDLTIDLVLEQAGASRRLLLAIAKTATGFPRHNALCLYVLACIATGTIAHNFAAMEVTLQENQHHVLAQCIVQAHMHGIHKELMKACLEGTKEIIREYGSPRGGNEPAEHVQPQLRADAGSRGARQYNEQRETNKVTDRKPRVTDRKPLTATEAGDNEDTEPEQKAS